MRRRSRVWPPGRSVAVGGRIAHSRSYAERTQYAIDRGNLSSPIRNRATASGVTRPGDPRYHAAMREKELRFALICYGGISLAVYMHGVTKEVWRLAVASRAFHDGGAIDGAGAAIRS